MEVRSIRMGTVLCALTIWTCLGTAAGAEISNGRRIILERGLQIQSLGFVNSTPAAPSSFSLWKDANFTTFSSWYDRDSEDSLHWTMPWSRWMRTDGTNPLTATESTQHLSELVSLQYGDELNGDTTGVLSDATMNTMAAAFASWHTQFGNNFLAYTNFNGNANQLSAAGVAKYLKVAKPDMLMFDAYPRNITSINTWYAEMQKYRVAGLAGIDGTGRAPIPYGQYLDLYRRVAGGSIPGDAFVHMQQSASWAFGYTFVTAFVYNRPNNSAVYSALFDGNGDTDQTAVYSYVAEANRQSLNLAPALIRLVSTDVRMIRSPGTALPAGISEWAPGAGNNNFITNITPILGPGANPSDTFSDVIVGYFQPLKTDNSDYPFADGTHFMIVNAASSGDAAEQSQWYRIRFNFGSTGYDSLQLLNRDTGLVEDVPLTQTSGNRYLLEWNLKGGDGDLFRFYNSNTVPEPAAGASMALAGSSLLLRRKRRRLDS